MKKNFKDSGIEWLGKIPAHWKICKLKYLFEIFSGTTPKSDKEIYWDGNIFWITPADYKSENKFVSKGHKNLTELGVKDYGLRLIPPSSLIFSKRAPIGEVAITRAELTINQGCLACIPKKNSQTTYYYYLLSILTEPFNLFGAGTTFKEISLSNFEKFFVTLPPIEEQKKIAAFLDKKCSAIDSAVDNAKKLVEKFREYKKSLITETVTKGLNPSAKMIDSNIEWLGEIPAHWKICRLKNLFEIFSGTTPKSDKEIYWNGNIFWITPADYKSENKFVSKGHKNLTELGVKDYGLRLIPPNSLIFSKRAPIGEVAIADTELTINQGCLACIPKKNSHTTYYYYLLSILTEQFNLFGAGTTFKEISLSNFERFSVILPPLEEQKEISNFLDKKCAAIDEKIYKHEKLAEKLTEYKKSLIYEVVTGKVEV